MRKLILFALFAVATASYAQVTVIPTGPFPTAAQMMEDFDSIAAGSYTSAPVWTSPIAGNVYALNPGGWLDIQPPVFPQPPAFSPPNTCVGVGSDIGITVAPIMRRFGAWFRNSPNSAGVAPTFAKVVFVDSTGVVVGSVGIPLTNTWVWHGWKVNPKFHEVDIYGSAGPGGVEIDDMEVKPV